MIDVLRVGTSNDAATVCRPIIRGMSTHSARTNFIAFVAALLTAASALAQPPGTPASPENVPTPTDVKPGSINHEDIVHLPSRTRRVPQIARGLVVAQRQITW